MSKKKRLLLSAFIFVGLFVLIMGIIPALNMEPGEIPIKSGQQTINKMRALQSTSSDPEGFDVNSYFSVFTHLSMQQGYVLDYLSFRNNMMFDNPAIYVRKIESVPLAGYEEYAQAVCPYPTGNSRDFFVSKVIGDNSAVFENKIVIDGSTQGYFEYTVLQEMGGQFYLFWHGNYDDARIICDRLSLVKVLFESINTPELSPISSLGLLARGMFIDFQPTVVSQGDNAIVKVVYFTKWGGFIQASYTISKNYPHTITDVEYKTLVKYQCGVLF